MYATTKYTYDCFNRTNGVQSADGGFIENRYDPEGLRCAIYENGYLSRFIFSGRDIVAELDKITTLKPQQSEDMKFLHRRIPRVTVIII
jgi:hypothetical protein